MKKLAFFDLDYTLYHGVSTYDFLKYLVENNVGNPENVLRADSLEKQYISGALNYDQISQTMVELLAKHVANYSTRQIQSLQKSYATQVTFFPWVKELFDRLQSTGYNTYCISAATSVAADAVTQILPFQAVFSSPAEISNNIYTGTLQYLLNNRLKQKAVEHIINKHLELDDQVYVLAFGDSTGDIPMLELADVAYVVQPHQAEMLTLAEKYAWEILEHNSQFNSLNIQFE